MGKEKKTTSKAFEVRITANALQNINEITGYIAFIAHQPGNAIKTGDAIFDTIDRIQRSPFAFRECEYLLTRSKIYRRAVCLSWIIIYKVISNEIVILGIIHSSKKPVSIRALKKLR